MTQPDVALGLLSALCQFGSFGASLFIGADELFLRRERLRRAAALQRATARGSLALHFLLEHPDVPPPAYMWRCKPANVIQRVRDEAARSNDIVFLNTSRDYFGCGVKYVEWFRVALTRYPTARYIAAGDDDVYVQFDHLHAELMSLVSTARALTAAPAAMGAAPAASAANELEQATGHSPRVYWGLILWRAYYNNWTMEPSANFEGWSVSDASAMRTRRGLERCMDAARAASGGFTGAFTSRGRKTTAPAPRACASIAPEMVAEMRRGELDASTPPFPIANGPLFALSRPLASDVVADALPSEWLQRFRASNPFVQQAMKRRKRPGGLNTGFRRRASKSCWPAGDVTLGWWITQLAMRRKLALWLVNAPIFEQHHPWPAVTHHPPTNRCVLVHKMPIKAPQLWEAVQARTRGPFEPARRVCGTCAEEMGWVTWPGSPVGRWRCCGRKLIK